MKTLAKIPMRLKKETKGTFVFEAIEDEQSVTQVYVKKGLFPSGAPATIEFTVGAGTDVPKGFWEAIIADLRELFDHADSDEVRADAEVALDRAEAFLANPEGFLALIEAGTATTPGGES